MPTRTPRPNRPGARATPAFAGRAYAGRGGDALFVVAGLESGHVRDELQRAARGRVQSDGAWSSDSRERTDGLARASERRKSERLSKSRLTQQGRNPLIRRRGHCPRTSRREKGPAGERRTALPAGQTLRSLSRGRGTGAPKGDQAGRQGIVRRSASVTGLDGGHCVLMTLLRNNRVAAAACSEARECRRL